MKKINSHIQNLTDNLAITKSKALKIFTGVIYNKISILGLLDNLKKTYSKYQFKVILIDGYRLNKSSYYCIEVSKDDVQGYFDTTGLINID